MSNEHLPIDHPWPGYGLHQLRASIDLIAQRPTTQVWLARAADALIYVGGAMLAFVVAVDGYVLLRTM